LFVEGPGGDDAAQRADASGPWAAGTPEFRRRVGRCRDDDLGDRGGLVAVLDQLRHHVVEGVAVLRVDRQRGVGPHHVRIELGVGVGGLDEQHANAVLADFVIQGFGVALDRVLGHMPSAVGPGMWSDAETDCSDRGNACTNLPNGAAR
jgi:hypothetical protein